MLPNLCGSLCNLLNDICYVTSNLNHVPLIQELRMFKNPKWKSHRMAKV